MRCSRLGLLIRQFLAPFHELQQRVLQAGLPALQRFQFVLDLGDLFGAHRAAVDQPAVAVLTLTYRVDLALELGHLGFQVFQCDAEDAYPVAGRGVRGLRLVHLLLFGQVLGAVRQAPEFGIDLGQREKRTLLFYFGFHALTFM